MHNSGAVRLGVLIGVLIAWGSHGAAPAPASQAAATAQPPIRVVPQLACEKAGLIDPTGRFAAVKLASGPTGWGGLTGLGVVDVQRKRLAWLFPPSLRERCNDEVSPGFSPNGMELALCTHRGGEIIDLRAGRITRADWLKGIAPVFSPDAKRIYVAGRSRPLQPPQLHNYADEVRVYTAAGRKIKSYPLRMNLVDRLSLSKDGRTLTVHGRTGAGLERRVGGRHVPARQAINLATGDSLHLEGPGGLRHPLPAGEGSNRKSVPTLTPWLGQWYRYLAWDESTASLAVTAVGSPEGYVTKLWDLKRARFRRSLSRKDTNNYLQLLKPGLMAGVFSCDRRALPPDVAAAVNAAEPGGRRRPQLVHLLPLPEGAPRPLGIVASRWLSVHASPDGRYIAGSTGEPGRRAQDRVQIWDVRRPVRVGEILFPKGQIHRYYWTPAGARLLVLRTAKDGRGPTWELFTPTGKSVGVVAKVPPWDVAFSPSGNLVAVRIEGDRPEAARYRVVVRRSITGEEVAAFPGDRVRPAMRFLDEDRLLIGDHFPDGLIQLVRVSDRSVLWQVKSRGHTTWASWQPGWSAIVVHSTIPTCADVLSVRDGRRIPPGKADDIFWYNPTLLRGARLAVDPVCNSNILRLVETATGRTIATLAAFADPEWIIYTPDGLWTGSPKALDWVAFYRGTEPLPAEETAALRQPKTVLARLERALGEKE